MNGVKRRILFYAETPFQIFAELCLYFTAYEKRSGERICVDFIIGDRFDGSGKYADRLKQLRVFDNVWLVPPAWQETKRFGVKFYIDYFFGRAKTRRWFFEQYPMLEGVEYDELVFSAPLRLLLYLKWFCGGNAKAILIEDGVGTYTGEMFDHIVFLDDIVNLADSDPLVMRVKHTLKRVINWVTRGRLSFHPEALYLFDTSGRVRDRYKGLEFRENIVPEGTGKEAVDSVFPVKAEEQYKENKYIFLTTTDLDSGSSGVEKQCFRTISQALGHKLLLRSHPRERKAFCSEKEYILDTDGDLWEMLIAKGCIDEGTTLFSLCSTAQLNPKLIFGVEPRLVFLFNLLPEGANWDIDVLEKTHLQAKSIYADPLKIYAPSSLEELSAIVNLIETQVSPDTV